MHVMSNIRILRIVSLLLFLTPAIALLGSLIFHNILVSFKFNHHEKIKIIKIKDYTPGKKIKILCSEENGFCSNDKIVSKKLTDCSKYNLYLQYSSIPGKKFAIDKMLDNTKNFSQQVFMTLEVSSNLEKSCILNYPKTLKYYNFVPFFFEKIANLLNNKNTSLGTSETINPIIYGESSISNIVKRYPLKFIFKPLLYLSVFFMIVYWLYYNLILNKILIKRRTNIFLIFGLLSSIFLLLHVIFLGWTFESEFLTKLRRSYIIFFILFEVLAQAFLIKEIYKIRNEISKYINNIIVYLKLGFVTIVCLSTLIILIILTVYNFDPKVDYILEWNYFLLLLLFYFLSSIMWKRN